MGAAGNDEVAGVEDCLFLTVFVLDDVFFLGILDVEQLPVWREDDDERHLLLAGAELGKDFGEFWIAFKPPVEFVEFGKNHDNTSFPSMAGTVMTPFLAMAWKNLGSAVSFRPLFDSMIFPFLSSR